MEEIVDDQIFTIADFLRPDECAAAIRATEEAGYDDAPITTELGPVMRPDLRNNTRVMFDDVALAAGLWARLAPQIAAPLARISTEPAIGLNERFRCYRYDPGQTFAWHQDGAYARPNGERSRLTFMAYLNDGFEGGETVFGLPPPHGTIRVVPRAGMALLFVHHLLHEGAAIRSGRKYVLRSDVMFAGPARAA